VAPERLSRGRTDICEATGLSGLILARLYAATVYACALLLAYVAGILSQTHAAGAAGDLLLVALAFAALAPPIWRVWRGQRAAMVAGAAAAVLAAAFFVVQDPKTLWIALAVPSLFVVLAVAALAASRGETPGPPAATGPKAAALAAALHAACAYAYGLALAFVTPTNYGGRMLFMGPPLATAYVLPLGLALGALSAPIARGRTWAMLVAFVLVSAHWLALANSHPSFWGDAAYWIAPAVSGALTLVVFVARVR
jgi:hypothetical protein